MSSNTIGAAVKKAREAVNYTVDDLAETCGLTVNEIVAVESGNHSDPAKLTRIAAALQVSVETLTA